jgi:hypothetical protein
MGSKKQAQERPVGSLEKQIVRVVVLRRACSKT